MSKEAFTILGGGCFWCMEGVFRQIDGINEVIPGYAGGDKMNPSYAEVSTGETGHAEVAKIKYDSDKLSYKEILEIFFSAHDPTTLNRQGDDVGTQYRSIIFYEDDGQKHLCFDMLKELINEKAFWDPIVTEVSELKEFYPAEKEHQGYYAKNKGESSYCQVVISPKIAKIRMKYRDRLKQ